MGTVLADPAPPAADQPRAARVATNLMRYLGPGVTLVSGPAGQPVVLAFADARLFAAIVLTIRGRLVTKIEAIADPSARAEATEARRVSSRRHRSAGRRAVGPRREIPGDHRRDLQEFRRVAGPSRRSRR